MFSRNIEKPGLEKCGNTPPDKAWQPEENKRQNKKKHPQTVKNKRKNNRKKTGKRSKNGKNTKQLKSKIPALASKRFHKPLVHSTEVVGFFSTCIFVGTRIDDPIIMDRSLVPD
jgi:hypothetical protein